MEGKAVAVVNTDAAGPGGEQESGAAGGGAEAEQRRGTSLHIPKHSHMKVDLIVCSPT